MGGMETALKDAGQIEVCEGDGSEAIASLVPPLSVCALVGAEDITREYAHVLRRKGVACVRAEEALDENVRLVVALGGTSELERAKRISGTVPVFALCCGEAVGALDDTYCSKFSLHDCAPPVGAAVLPPPASALPAVLGDVCAASLGAMDGVAMAVLRGEPIPEFSEVFSLCYRALEICRLGRHNEETGVRLVRLGLEIGQKGRERGVRLARGGADACARALQLLARHERRAVPPHGECVFLCGELLASLYKAFIAAPPRFCPPPDDNLRAEALHEFFGLPPLLCTRLSVPRLSSLPLAAYRLREYRDELSDAAGEAVRIFAEAKHAFCRLFADDGYAFTRAFDQSDCRLAIALAPEVAAAPSFLDAMRLFGVLDSALPPEF